MAKEKLGLFQGTRHRMVLRTLDAIRPLQGDGIARRIEQSGRRARIGFGGAERAKDLHREREDRRCSIS